MRRIFFYIVLFSFHVAGVIKTTGRKLDRENQAEHILEVSTTNTHYLVLTLLLFQISTLHFFVCLW
jgi:hypothetical protein